VSNGNERRSRITREKILDAAEPVFLERGFEGSSLGAIASGAGVNTSLISHHFGSKRGLWEATVQRLSRRYFRLQMQTLEQGEGRGLDLLTDSVAAYQRHVNQTPGVARLMAWQFLAGERRPSDEAREVIELGFVRLRAGQQLGLVREDLAPEMIWAMFISLADGWALLKDGYGELLSAAAGPDGDLDRAYMDTVLSVFLDGVRGPQG